MIANTGMSVYYTQRLTSMLRLRTPSAWVVSQAINLWLNAKGNPRISPRQDRDSPVLRALRSSGYSSVGKRLTDQEIYDIRDDLRTKPHFDFDHPERAMIGEHNPDNVRYSFYRAADILTCPHLLRVINSKDILSSVEGYLGCKATIAQIELRWTFANELQQGRFQLFHRDTDDWRFVKLFLYLTDVDERSGPLTLVTGSHRMPAALRARYWSDDDIDARFSKDRMISLMGRAGASWLVDTFAFHQGRKPIERPRLALLVQYSLLPYFPHTYEARLPIISCSTQHLDPYINRLFVEV